MIWIDCSKYIIPDNLWADHKKTYDCISAAIFDQLFLRYAILKMDSRNFVYIVPGSLCL